METEKYKNFLKNVRSLDGVNGAIIVSSDGGVLATDLNSDIDINEISSTTAFSAGLAMQIEKDLSLGKFESVVIEGRDYKIIILSKGDITIGMLTEPYVSVNTLKSEVDKINL